MEVHRPNEAYRGRTILMIIDQKIILDFIIKTIKLMIRFVPPVFAISPPPHVDFFVVRELVQPWRGEPHTIPSRPTSRTSQTPLSYPALM